MTAQESIRQAARLRFRMHLNARLRLESLAALSRVFREYGEPIHEELLGSLVFAVPQELLGEASPDHMSGRDIMRPLEAQHGKPSAPPPGREPGPPPERGPGGRPNAPPKPGKH